MPGKTTLIENEEEEEGEAASCTELGYKVVPRLRELAPRGKRDPGYGIHAT